MIEFDKFATMNVQQINEYFWDQTEDMIGQIKNQAVRSRMVKYVLVLKAQQDDSKLVENGIGKIISDRIMRAYEEEGDL